MFSAKSVHADHKDLVHDVAYDFYGRRFATCSSDHTVKVWDMDEDGEWYCSSSFKAHSGSVWKVTWAHPEFGQVLATCSFDRTVAIWEEKLDGSSSPTTSNSNAPQHGTTTTQQVGSPSSTSPTSSWIRRANLVDSRASITDVKFSPKHLGLLLATCSSDGTLRIYEAPDIMNLSQWNPQYDLNCKMSCSCLSWNPSPFSLPMIAVGSDEPIPSSSLSRNPSIVSGIGRSNSITSSTSTTGSTLGRIQIYESSENSRRWIRVEAVPVFEPVYDLAFGCNFGRDYYLLAVASSDVKILALSESTATSHLQPNTPGEQDIRSTAMSSSFMSPSSITGSSFFPQSASDRYHPFSTGSNRQQLEQQQSGGASAGGNQTPRYEVRTIAQFDDHNSRVWRVSWNLTGTILATSGEDARIRLWKCKSLIHLWILFSCHLCLREEIGMSLVDCVLHYKHRQDREERNMCCLYGCWMLHASVRPRFAMDFLFPPVNRFSFLSWRSQRERNGKDRVEIVSVRDRDPHPLFCRSIYFFSFSIFSL